MRGISKRHTDIFGLSARIAAGQMRVAEQACGRVAESLGCEFLIAVGSFTDGEIAAFALVAFAADDGERNDDPIADLELA